MQCPICHIDLLISERQGIEIDYCPKCRGIWLDRGELDKIIQKSNEDYNSDNYPRERIHKDKKDEPQVIKRDRYYDNDYYKQKKRKSFLDDLFDF